MGCYARKGLGLAENSGVWLAETRPASACILAAETPRIIEDLGWISSESWCALFDVLMASVFPAFLEPGPKQRRIPTLALFRCGSALAHSGHSPVSQQNRASHNPSIPSRFFTCQRLETFGPGYQQSSSPRHGIFLSAVLDMHHLISYDHRQWSLTARR